MPTLQIRLRLNALTAGPFMRTAIAIILTFGLARGGLCDEKARQAASDFPSIAGVWQESPSVALTISQSGEDFKAECEYTAKDGAAIRWEMDAMIDHGGRILGLLRHVQAPKGWAQTQTRSGRLSADGNEIAGVAIFADAEHPFRWTRRDSIRPTSRPAFPPNPRTSPAATAAIQQANKAIADAESVYKTAVIRAKRAEVDALKAALATAKRKSEDAQAAAIAATIETLTDEIEGRPTTPTAQVPATAFKPATTFTDRAKKATANADRRVNVKGALKRATDIDAFLNDYLTRNKVPDEVAASMWRGEPKLGMPIEVVKQIGRLHVTSESAGTVEGEFFIETFSEFFPVGLPGVIPVDYWVYSTNGVVTRLENPRSGSGGVGLGQRHL